MWMYVLGIQMLLTAEGVQVLVDVGVRRIEFGPD